VPRRPADAEFAPNGKQSALSGIASSTRVSSDHLRRLPECAQGGTAHAVTIGKTRLPSDDFDRMAALLHHQPGDLEAEVLDRLGRRLAGLGGFAASREISRRAGDDEGQFVGDAHRNHVAFDPLADANAGIETLGDDVDQSLIAGQFQRNLGILRQKPRNDRTEKQIGGRWRGRKAQYAGRLAAELVYRFQRRLVFVKHRTQPLEKTA
jgi:hypothetical protein